MRASLTRLWGFVLERLHGTAHQYITKRIIFTIPNLITTLGLVGVVMYGYLAWQQPENLPLFFILGVIIVLSDALDGIAADWFSQHSRLGKVLDPLRDRAFAAVLLLHLWQLQPTAWLLIPILLITIIEVCVAWTFVNKKRREIHSLGKIKTITQWLLVGSCIAFHGMMTDLIVVMIISLAAGMSALSLIAYRCTTPQG